MAVVKNTNAGPTDEAARRREALAMADLIKFLGGMLLMASIAVLLLGAFGYEKDRRERNAMGKAVATVTEEYEHGGAYYIVYEADGAAHEALMGYPKGTLSVGDQVTIRHDPVCYSDVRLDGPKAMYVNTLAYGALGLTLGVLAQFGQVYLRGKHANPWHEGEEE